MDDVYAQIIEKIIAQQEAIIGPIAIQQAEMVGELKIDWPQHSVNISGSPQVAIDDLVQQYKDLFGQIAVETCKEAASKLLSQLPANEQPKSLQ
jgi:predicted Zn-dependent protease